MLFNKKIGIKSNISKMIYDSNLNVMQDNAEASSWVADESITEIIVEAMPTNMNVLEKMKWYKYKENLLLQNAYFKRFVVGKWCVWLYTNDSVKVHKWSILEQVKSLKQLVNHTESEIWFFDDGRSKICFCLLKGVLVYFKRVEDFSDSLLENFIQHMKNYSFQAPKVRLFGSYFDFNYDVQSYSVDFIERSLSLPIDKIKFKYLKDLNNIFKTILAGACVFCTMVFLSFSFNWKANKNQLDVCKLENKISFVSKALLSYPQISHIQDLNYHFNKKVKFFRFLDSLKDLKYKIKFFSKNQLKIDVAKEKMSYIKNIVQKYGIFIVD